MLDGVMIDAFERGGEVRGEHEADRDRLAVQQRVTGRDLERVGERVPVVEDRARTRFARARRRRRTRALISDARARSTSPSTAGSRATRPAERARDEVVTEQSRTSRSRRVRSGTRGRTTSRALSGVGEHRDRLVERADQVLALGQVDPGLAADRGVDHRQQRGRHLHHVDATVVHRGGEAGGVADHPAAQRDHRVAAQQAPLRELPAQVVDGGERLVVFALAHEEDLVRDARLGEHGPRRCRRTPSGSRPGSRPRRAGGPRAPSPDPRSRRRPTTMS